MVEDLGFYPGGGRSPATKEITAARHGRGRQRGSGGSWARARARQGAARHGEDDGGGGVERCVLARRMAATERWRRMVSSGRARSDATLHKKKSNGRSGGRASVWGGR